MAFTFFFRDMQILELIVKHALPGLAGRSRIRIWDAGCAMGQETYSLAIMLAENMGHFSFGNVQIYATDVEENRSFGDTVRSGVYSDEDLKRIPPHLLEKYFVSSKTAPGSRQLRPSGRGLPTSGMICSVFKQQATASVWCCVKTYYSIFSSRNGSRS